MFWLLVSTYFDADRIECKQLSRSEDYKSVKTIFKAAVMLFFAFKAVLHEKTFASEAKVTQVETKEADEGGTTSDPGPL